MQKFTFTIFVMLILSACNYKVYVNGKFDHIDKRGDSAKNNSCFVIDDNSLFPDSAAFINETKITKTKKKKFIEKPSDEYFAYQEIIKKAKLEAGKARGNLIKIVNYGHPKTFFKIDNGSKIEIQFETYLLEERFMAHYQKKIDSIKTQNKYISTIYVKCDNWRGLTDKVYFNDSLICEFPTKTKMKDRLFNWQTNKNGILLYENNYNGKNEWKKDNIKIETGNEYYFRLRASKYGGKITKVDKFRFYYLNS